MMQNFFIFFLLPFLLLASPIKKEFRRSNYDEVLNLVAKEVVRGTVTHKELTMMDHAYGIVNQIDTEEIVVLSQEGVIENYKNIIAIYERLIDRQKQIEMIKPVLKGNFLHLYEGVNYIHRLDVFKQNVANRLYVEGKKILNEGTTKVEFRKAYIHFAEVRKLMGSNYKDLRDLSGDAKDRGLTRISLDMVNANQQNLPRHMAKKVFSYGSTSISDEWIQFYTPPYPQQAYDYKIQVKINKMNISKNLRDQTTRSFKRGLHIIPIHDSFRRVKTSKNEAKEIHDNHGVYTWTKVKQLKFIDALVEILLIDAASNKVIVTESFVARKVFKNQYYQAEGDMSTLSEEHSFKLQKSTGPKRYPTNTHMLNMLMDKVKWEARAVILKLRSNIE